MLNPLRIECEQDALAAYFEDAAEKGIDVPWPDQSCTEAVAGGWLLENVNGFLAMVTNDGRVEYKEREAHG